MKRTFLLFAFVASLFINNVHAQSFKWAYTNDLPESFTNSPPMLTLTSLKDDAGGSAWLYQANTIFFPGFGTPLTRLIWLNKFGRPILTNDFGPQDVSTGAWLVRLTTTELTVQLSGFNAGLFQNTNVLRKYKLVRGVVTQKDTPLELNERVVGTALAPLPVNDRTGFFTWTSLLPTTPEFVIRRYSK